MDIVFQSEDHLEMLHGHVISKPSDFQSGLILSVATQDKEIEEYGSHWLAVNQKH